MQFSRNTKRRIHIGKRLQSRNTGFDDKRQRRQFLTRLSVRFIACVAQFFQIGNVDLFMVGDVQDVLPVCRHAAANNLTDIVQRDVFATAKQGIIIAWNPRAGVGVCDDPNQHADGQGGAVLCHTVAKATACRCFANVGDSDSIACLDLPIYDLVCALRKRIVYGSSVTSSLLSNMMFCSKKITGTSSIAG